MSSSYHYAPEYNERPKNRPTNHKRRVIKNEHEFDKKSSCSRTCKLCKKRLNDLENEYKKLQKIISDSDSSSGHSENQYPKNKVLCKHLGKCSCKKHCFTEGSKSSETSGRRSISPSGQSSIQSDRKTCMRSRSKSCSKRDDSGIKNVEVVELFGDECGHRCPARKKDFEILSLEDSEDERKFSRKRSVASIRKRSRRSIRNRSGKDKISSATSERGSSKHSTRADGTMYTNLWNAVPDLHRMLFGPTLDETLLRALQTVHDALYPNTGDTTGNESSTSKNRSEISNKNYQRKHKENYETDDNSTVLASTESISTPKSIADDRYSRDTSKDTIPIAPAIVDETKKNKSDPKVCTRCCEKILSIQKKLERSMSHRKNSPFGDYFEKDKTELFNKAFVEEKEEDVEEPKDRTCGDSAAIDYKKASESIRLAMGECKQCSSRMTDNNSKYLRSWNLASADEKPVRYESKEDDERCGVQGHSFCQHSKITRENHSNTLRLSNKQSEGNRVIELQPKSELLGATYDKRNTLDLYPTTPVIEIRESELRKSSKYRQPQSSAVKEAGDNSNVLDHPINTEYALTRIKNFGVYKTYEMLRTPVPQMKASKHRVKGIFIVRSKE